MNKKGDLTINTIILTILALLVLIVLAIAFRSQIADLFGAFSNLIKDALGLSSQVDISSITK